MDLMFTARNCYQESLIEVGFIEHLLLELAESCEMKVISGPFVMFYDGGSQPSDEGITGFVIIAESHIAIHTWPLRGGVELRISSCKSFNSALITEDLEETFGGEVEALQINFGYSYLEEVRQ